VLGGTGRTLMTAGILILLFVAYGLWGTGVFTAREQRKLEKDFDVAKAQYQDQLTTTTTGPTTTDPTGPTPTTTPHGTPNGVPNGAVDIALPTIEAGAPIGQIRIPKIGVDWTFVQGTTKDDLHKGPGHYLGTPYPGQVGNAAIAGHRTTNGAPFNRINEIDPGDFIEIETFWGDFTYQVYCEMVVDDSDTWVAGTPTNCNRQAAADGAVEITLTSCHPKRSAAQRYVIKAELLVDQSDAPATFDPSQFSDGVAALPGEDDPPDLSGEFISNEAALRSGLAGDPTSRGPAVAWAAITAIVGLLWWWAYRRYRHWLTWLVGLMPFAVVLFGAYYFLERTLPAGY
jgi:sortase A